VKYRQISGRIGITALSAVMAGALLLGACGTAAPASAPPKQAVNQAFDALGAQAGIDLRVSLGVSAAQLQKMATTNGGSSGLTAQNAKDIAESSIVVAYSTGNGKSINDSQAATDPAQRFGLAVQVGASAPLELRDVNQTIYLKADLATLLKDLGQDSTPANGFSRAVEGANQYIPGLSVLAQGGWVSVPASALTGLLQGLQTELPSSSSSASTPATSGQILSQLHLAFTSNTTYALAGAPGPRTHYKLTLAVKPFVHEVLTALGSSLGNLSSVPGASSIANNINSAIAKIPANQKLVADVWVSNKKAQEIDIDLNQFDHRYAFAVPLRILIGPGEPITIPAQHTPLNLSKLGQMLGGMLGGAGTST
jgi:hypothetical protein